jgi:hypothetical protein
MQNVIGMMTAIKSFPHILLFFLAFLAPWHAHAQSLSIHETQTLTFPTIGLPAGGGTANLSISPLNSSTSGSGQIISGMASRGQYALSRSAEGTPVSISIDISNVSLGNPGLTLDTFRGFYAGQTIDSFPSSTLPLPAIAPGNTPLYLGAKVTANSSVAPGNYNGGFSITVFIQ